MHEEYEKNYQEVIEHLRLKGVRITETRKL